LIFTIEKSLAKKEKPIKSETH